jgi:hypothetical protein
MSATAKSSSARVASLVNERAEGKDQSAGYHHPGPLRYFYLCMNVGGKFVGLPFGR